MDSGPRKVILVMARHPDYGPVKTRLAATVGAEEARRIYRDLAETVWEGLADPEFERWLVVEPPQAATEAGNWLLGADRILGQAAGDLGARMAAAFDAAFRAAAPAVAVVGTDAPRIDAGSVRAAFGSLGEFDVGIVPSHDGGYALLALGRHCPELFADIPWSTERVMESTRQRARALDLRLSEFPAVQDLDTFEDLQAIERLGEWNAPRHRKGGAPP